MDYLAEVTMSILQKQKLRYPEMGYARDFPETLREILPDIKEKGIKIISNAGGVNPEACRDKVLEIANELGIRNLKIGLILGDNILDQIDDFIAAGTTLNHMETGEPLSMVRDKILSANVYLGAFPMVEALQQGADIVIAGRATDTGLTLAPMIYEFGWKPTDYDKLATGTVAGHIMECGAQASGGNFLGDWRAVPNMHDIGFPIVEAYPDGTFEVTKHENMGGLVNSATVKEQLLYEIGDPTAYITPDCIADFTTIQLDNIAPNRVKVTGIKGYPETPYYKVSAAYAAGFSTAATLVYSWPDALEKAQYAFDILKKRCDALGLRFDEIHADYIGANACHLDVADPQDQYNEVMLRVAVKSQYKEDIARFGREIAPLILTGPPAVTGFAGGRPRPSEVVAYWPALIEKTLINPKVDVR